MKNLKKITSSHPPIEMKGQLFFSVMSVYHLTNTFTHDYLCDWTLLFHVQREGGSLSGLSALSAEQRGLACSMIGKHLCNGAA